MLIYPHSVCYEVHQGAHDLRATVDLAIRANRG